MHIRLVITIPKSRPFSTTINILREKFPFREGEWYSETVSDEHGAPCGFDLGYIVLTAPLSDTQRTYLEHGKTAGFITDYTVKESEEED